MVDPPASTHDLPGKRERVIWLMVLAGLCLWVAWRLGAFDLTNTISVDGRKVTVPNVFATVDHPFHATRAHTLLESLKHGDILRWVGNHQGGYPAEFYPLGAAWLDVGLWALFLGTQSIVALHKLAVILIFLLPAVSYWLLARGDRVHPGIAVLATAIHFAVPGTWLNGGYTELVGWGLVTNVAGGSLALLAAVALARFVIGHEQGMGVLAILAAAAGACTNPRSLFAVVIAAVAIVVVASAGGGREGWRSRLGEAMVRTGMVGGIAVLLAAPVVLSLFRYNTEYFFLHYEFYDPISMFWDASTTAVTLPVLIVAIAGACWAITRRQWHVSQAMALTLGLYALFTVWVATTTWSPPLVEQLEAPRLMPFQRQLMIWFGALAVGGILQWLASRIHAFHRWRIDSVLYGILALTVLVVLVRPLPFVSDDYRGMMPVGTTGDADYALFQEAIGEADALHVEGTSIFVIGNRWDWWHQQLWAPVASDAPFYYDDWLWYWTTTHKGPYDYRNGHYFPNPAEALTSSYLGDNGISVVVVTDMPEAPQSPREAARSNPLLEFDRTIGQWDIYRVRQPTSLVTNGGQVPSSIDVQNERIHATFDDGDGTIVIRRNWFPRWEVLVNGVSVPVTHRADGYMEVATGAGPVDVEIRYVVTSMDWLARVASVTGVVGLLAFAMTGRRILPKWIGIRSMTGTITPD